MPSVSSFRGPLATDRVPACRVPLLAALLALSAAAPWMPAPAGAQAPLFLVDGETRVASLSFAFQGENPFDEGRLTRRMATEGPGFLAGLRRRLAWLPLVSDPDAIPFEPVTLQRDVVRLRRYYHANGFPRARVDYRVQLDTARNAVDVVMDIRPGPPRTLGPVRVVAGASPPARLELDALRRDLDGNTGMRLGEGEVEDLRAQSVAWARQRGFPFARAEVALEGEDPLRPRLVVWLDPGPVATVDAIRVPDDLHLDATTVRRQLLLREGDTFSARRLDASARQLLDLDLVEVALVQPEPDQPRDSTVSIGVRLGESDRHLVSGRAGYADTRGVLTEVEWADRNFQGGARILRATALAETGVWAAGDLPRERYGGSLSVEQPWVGDPRVSGVLSLYADYSDGPREEARATGADVDLVWQRGPERFLSLRYGISVRDVLDFRGGAGSRERGVLEYLRELEELGGSTRRTALTLSGGWRRRDGASRPGGGWSVQASLEAAGPDGWSDVQYLQGDLSAAWLLEVDSAGPRLLVRGRGGRLLPLGRSRPGDNPLASFLQLGDAVFLEGGTQRVRGWEDGALGPKLPDLDLVPEGDSVRASPANRYVPLGGLARLGGSVEVQLPLPFPSGSYGIVFLDGARVWTPDRGFLGEDGLPALASDDALRFGTGLGVSVDSPVGPVRVMVGYKLNPSLLDVRAPGAVARALLNDTEVAAIPENPWRRWQLHLALGRVF